MGRKKNRPILCVLSQAITNQLILAPDQRLRPLYHVSGVGGASGLQAKLLHFIGQMSRQETQKTNNDYDHI